MKKILLLFLLLTGCIHFPDVPLCIHEAANEEHGPRGYCDSTLDPDKHEAFYVDNVSKFYTDSNGNVFTWDQLQTISFVVPPDTWAAISGYLQKLCHRYPQSCGGVGQYGTPAAEFESRMQINTQIILKNR